MENPTSDRVIANGYGDSGGASRFFPTFRYQAKAPKKERPTIDGKGWPTVKPLGLMQWLARLLCPPGGTVLDPFPGTGTTGRAAQIEGFDSVLIERDEFARDLIAVRIPDVVLGAVPEPAEPEPVPVPVEPAPEPESVTTWDLLVSIAAATSGAELRAIHTEHMAVWNEECTAALVARVDELAAQESVA